MTRPRLLHAATVGVRLVAGLALPLVAGALEAAPSLAQARPDIVFVLTDDQAFHQLAAMHAVDTLLVRRGVRFLNYTATTPLCGPSRATELSGQYAHVHGVYTNDSKPDLPQGGAVSFRDTSTVAVWLKRAGYRTGHIGKYINGYDHKRPWPYVPPGWDDWRSPKRMQFYNYVMVENGVEVSYGSGDSNYLTNVMADKAVDFIRATPSGQPLYLHFTPYAPHAPADYPSQDATLFSGATWRSPNHGEADVSDKPAWVRGLTWSSTKEGQTDVFYVKQLRSLQAVDRAVARIAQALADAGRLDNTVFVLASDNGYALGAHRHVAKHCVYEECVLAPFVVRAPGVLPRDEPALVQSIDVAPTLADFAGATPTISFSGASFKNLLYDPSAPWRQTSLIEMIARQYPTENPVDPYAAVRTGRYTYVELATGEVELYDRASDSHQLQNVAGVAAYAAIRDSLDRELDRLHVNALPQAAFTSSCSGLACSFTDTSTDSDGVAYAWEWAFGDGGTATQAKPSHTYAGPGTYDVTLSVRDNRGGTAAVTKAVTVTGGAQAPFGGTARALPGTVQAEDFDEGGEGVAYHDTDAGNNGGQYRTSDVDIGTTPGGYVLGWARQGEWLEYSVNVAQAGTYVLEARVASNVTGGAFSFQVPGDTLQLAVPYTGGWHVYQIVSGPLTLTAGPQVLRVEMPLASSSGSVGNLDSFALSATANAAPTASFTSSCTGLTCSFTDASTDADGSVTGWSWSFGDGATSTQRHPTRTYAAGGTYTVTLTVTDDDGATGTTTRSVTAQAGNQAPSASFNTSCWGLTCSFTDASTDADGSVTGWSWSFGDGATSTQRHPTRTYAAPGTYTVRLTVTDDDGATGSAQRTGEAKQNGRSRW